MGGEGGTGTVAQGGLRVSRGKACGVWRSFRIARLSRGRTRATKECGGTGAVGQRPQGGGVVNMGTVPVPGSAGAYTCMDLDRQWGRWGHMVIYRHCDFSFHLSTDRKQSLLFSVAFAPYRLFRLFRSYLRFA